MNISQMLPVDSSFPESHSNITLSDRRDGVWVVRQTLSDMVSTRDVSLGDVTQLLKNGFK